MDCKTRNPHSPWIRIPFLQREAWERLIITYYFAPDYTEILDAKPQGNGVCIPSA
jgi:hypothetical protein